MIIAEEICKWIEKLDLEPQLDREIIDIPSNRFVILSDGKSSYCKEYPKYYLINKRDYSGTYPENMLAVIFAAKAVRKRVQHINKDLKIFGKGCDLPENLCVRLESLALLTEDEFDFDAELCGRVLGFMVEKGASLEECKKILTADADKFINVIESMP